MSIKNYTLGCDAEVFLRALDGRPFPVCGMVGGTKEKPLPLEALGEGFAIQEDNAALEYNIPAAKDYVNWDYSLQAVRTHIQNKLPRAVDLDYSKSSCVFNEAFLQIPEMQRFGCDPDYNAYTMRVNDTPRPPVPGFRSAAAHIHIGWEKPTDEDRLELIRLSDVFVCLPYLPYENKSEIERRKLYGRAGSFRVKEYGVEHRVMSNRWAAGGSGAYYTWYAYAKAINALNCGIVVDPQDYGKIATAINSHQVHAATALYKKYDALYQSKGFWLDGNPMNVLEDFA